MASNKTNLRPIYRSANKLKHNIEYYVNKKVAKKLKESIITNVMTSFGPETTHGKEVNHGIGFCEYLNNDTSKEVCNKLKNKRLNYPYCFRSRYNKYTGKKDGVPTRSLHAEENTMLRIAHRGGTSLEGGTMYVTASPCVLCSKKAYQIGIRDIVYLDPYTDIAPDLILHCGFDQPRLRVFTGALGSTFYKLYQPFLPLKDELAIYEKTIKPTK